MMTVDASVPVVVLTTSPHSLLHSPLAIARSLGRFGVRVYTAHPGPPLPYDRSRHLAGRFAITADSTDPVQLAHDLTRIGDRVEGDAILIPIDDAAALNVDEYAGTLARCFRFPSRPTGLAAALARKHELHRLCEQYGVPAPRTDLVSHPQELRDYAAGAQFPVAVKINCPDRRPNGSPSVFLARDFPGLLEAYERFSGGVEQSLVLQEYIPGDVDSLWMFNGYFDAYSRCLAAFTGVKARQTPPDTGPASLGICRDNPTIKTMTVELLSRLGYTGPVDVDYRFDPRDRQYKLLDVNPRVGGTFRLFVGDNGMDVVRALYLDLTGQPPRPASSPEGRRWLDEPHDLYASLRYGRQARLSPIQWALSLRGVREGAWLSADDPTPVLAVLPPVIRAALSVAGNRSGRAQNAAAARYTYPSESTPISR